jgi:transcriptional regulator with XRE-family HTH domain
VFAIEPHSHFMKLERHHHYSDRIALGMRLKEWRMRDDRKISQVAVLPGVSTATWGHWETGERMPSGNLLLAIEDLTQMPFLALWKSSARSMTGTGFGFFGTAHPP